MDTLCISPVNDISIHNIISPVPHFCDFYLQLPICYLALGLDSELQFILCHYCFTSLLSLHTHVFSTRNLKSQFLKNTVLLSHSFCSSSFVSDRSVPQLLRMIPVWMITFKILNSHGRKDVHIKYISHIKGSLSYLKLNLKSSKIPNDNFLYSSFAIVLLYICDTFANFRW